MISLWVQRPVNSVGQWLGRPQESSWAAAAGPGNDIVSFQVPCRVTLYQFWTPGAWCSQRLELGPHGEGALARVRVLSRDVARAEATPVS